jgi:gluconolactonase
MRAVSETFEKVADGIPGAEGPVFDRAGRFFVVEPFAGKILQIQSAGQKREQANTGGIPAGLAVDARDHLWVADMKLGLLRVRPTGEVESIVSQFEGQPIRGCNDLVLDAEENVYCTAPAGSNWKERVGELYCWLASSRKLLRLDAGFAFCNGIALTADQRTLIVAETMTKTLWAYDVDSPGQVKNKRHWATLPGEHHGGPDGIDFDTAGNLLATNWGGGSIDVFDPRGALIERVITPFEKPSNLHFGGADGCDLYVTEHTNDAVWKTRWKRPGLLALHRS